MKYLSQYSIAFKGLKDGEHSFEFEISDKFFEYFENSEVSKGEIKATIQLKKTTTLLTLIFEVKGEVELTCDRCLELYKHQVDNTTTMYVKFGHEAEDQGDEIIVIHFEDHEINIAQLLYEQVILDLPIKHVHPNDENGNSTCDPEMLDRLDNYIVEDEDEEPPVDERWSELKKLLDN